MPDKKTKRPLAKFALIGGLLVAAGATSTTTGGEERRSLRSLLSGPRTLS